MKNIFLSGKKLGGKVRNLARRLNRIPPPLGEGVIAPFTVTESGLDEFVAKTDALGGPNSSGSADYWAAFRYEPTTQIDESMDPFGDAYYAQQIKLYEEISGRTLDQSSNEQCLVDVANHTAAPNPYNHSNPSVLAGQLITLSTVCHLANAPRGSRVLDMGCGWGLSSEMLAYCGFVVDAVDINHEFVELVNARARRLGLPIHAVQSSFDEFRPPTGQGYAFSLFYECFHHATRPWELMRSVVNMLEPDGKFILAREAVSSTYWKHWGLRLDPLSVYCIRKFGWFESGWSLEFLTRMFERTGLRLTTASVNGVPNEIFIGQQIDVLSSTDLKLMAPLTSWWHEEEWIVSNGDSSMAISLPPQTKSIVVTVGNFSTLPIDLEIGFGEKTNEFRLEHQGKNVLTIPCDGREGAQTLRFKSEPWCPNERFKNGDARHISVHVGAMQFRKN